MVEASKVRKNLYIRVSGVVVRVTQRKKLNPDQIVIRFYECGQGWPTEGFEVYGHQAFRSVIVGVTDLVELAAPPGASTDGQRIVERYFMSGS